MSENDVDVLRERISEVSRQCEAKHLRNNQASLEAKEIALAALGRAQSNTQRLTSLSGEDGRNGIVGENRKDVADHEQRLRSVEQTVQRNDVKLIMYSSGFSALFATVLGVLAHYFTR